MSVPAELPRGSTAGGNRQELKLRVFQWCDRDGDGLLKLEEMFELARMVGFEGTDAEWREEFKRLCQERGATEAGIPAETVLQLLDDESDSGCFCTDEELGMLCAACGAAPAAEASAAASTSSTAGAAAAAASADPDTGASAAASGEGESSACGDRSAADPKDADPEVPTTPPATAAPSEAGAAGEAAKESEDKEASLPLAKPSEDDTEAAPPEEDPVRSADFSRWLESTELPVDTVELQLDEGKVTAHAFILAARSTAFRSLLTDAGKSVSLAGVRRAPLLLVLRYLYSGGSVEVSGEDAAEVFELAVRFELPMLCTQLVTVLCKSVEVENALGLFTLSEQHQTQLNQLKERCVEVIQDNLETVCSAPNFQDFCRKPEQVRSLFLATASEPPQKRRRKQA